MSRRDWLPDFLARLAAEHLLARAADEALLAPALRLVLDPEDWGAAAKVAAHIGLRHAGVWADASEGAGVPASFAANLVAGVAADLDGEHDPQRIAVYACLEHLGGYLVLETAVPLERPVLPSQTPHYPGLDRLERHCHDLTGVVFQGHPDPRRWTRHQAWEEDAFPLRTDFPTAGRSGGRVPADADYPFLTVQGSGVYEIPVGPVHAGIIEPGHFRFQAMGEEVLRLEERLGYVHKGIEKIAEGRDPEGLARLAARVCGDSTVAHTWAACQAMERATACAAPPRADWLRALMAERERVANHLGDIGAICNDVGFSFAHMQCARLRELWQRRSRELFGHRLMMDAICPGGVAADLSADASALLQADHMALRAAAIPLFDVIDDHPSLNDRLITTGHLSTAQARNLGCTGSVGKASGLAFDVRRDCPYPPYDMLEVVVPQESDGDVAARVRVRMTEIQESLILMDRLIRTLPTGKIRVPLRPAPPGAVGLGLVDGWRGEIMTFVRFDTDGGIARFFPRDPSWFTWPALEQLIMGNIVPDFPVCNKSVNGSYSGEDL
ncbi:NADH-quinone oxidoreductase subunit C [uncultured Thiodictyon sp.]|uniref:hydrogenase large subunit n=1 Tax=uncultured Thiodictyon sp. TaxID=1846217 RepID=UPI0025E8135A|nr:NADH-quinone oxidoreductase subunit C [uncultured Thiodictyon sp.]